MATRIVTQGSPAQGLIIDDSSDLPTTRTVARGLLNMAAAAWAGAHPGFTDVVTDTGVGNQTVHLAADGNPLTMCARCVPNGVQGHAYQNGPLGGVGNRDLVINAADWGGSDSNPAGWGAGAHLPNGAALADMTVHIEVIEYA